MAFRVIFTQVGGPTLKNIYFYLVISGGIPALFCDWMKLLLYILEMMKKGKEDHNQWIATKIVSALRICSQQEQRTRHLLLLSTTTSALGSAPTTRLPQIVLKKNTGLPAQGCCLLLWLWLLYTAVSERFSAESESLELIPIDVRHIWDGVYISRATFAPKAFCQIKNP